MRKFLGVCLTCCLFGVMVLVVLAAIVRQKGSTPPAGVALETNLVYGKGGDQALTLDLTRPKEGQGPFPAIVFVHGGGWVGGDKESYHPFMFHFTQAGIVCITINYRLAPKNRFPAQIEDARCAVRWLRANAGKYHVDPHRIAAFGGSAGAHLVALLGTTNGSKRWEGSGGNPEQSSAICAMVCMSGPYDLSLGYLHSVRQNAQEGGAVRGMLEAFLGGTPEQREAEYRAASPMTYASKDTVPTLLTHGTADPLVPPEQSEVFYSKLKSLGVDVELIRLEGAGHADFGKHPQEAIARITAFVRKQLLSPDKSSPH